jgi:catechol 2,3-dioxygenase-like lactoylglutathione lyase family enzyme
MPRISGLLESVLYAADMARATGFYRDVIELPIMFESPRLTAFDAGRQGVLLLFQQGATADDVPTRGGTIPGHDGNGPVHMAFAIPNEDYEAWREHLAAHGVALLSEVAWPAGGRSLYFNDPDSHVIELATPGLWPNY